jgi:SPP1 gp7 family putative phage head morphogenesis protein
MKEAQEKQANKSIKETQKQLRAYYIRAMKSVLDGFTATYDKLLSTMGEGEIPTPADLYKLDKYWKLQGRLKRELQRLGDNQIAELSKKFEEEFWCIYEAMALTSQEAFSSMSKEGARQLINQIWCADGKSWSQRVWNNTDRLQQALNDKLTECVITGKTTSQLKKFLQDEFGVSYNRADTIVRTEMAHIQTQAARQRYQEYGIQEIEIYADTDNRTCPICAKLDGKRFGINDSLPIPAHPRCRCCALPVIKEGVKGKLFTPESEPTIMKSKAATKSKKEAVDKVHELQQSGTKLHFFKRTHSHQRHAEELTGLTGDEAWEKYEEMADEFLKKEIDGEDMEGFVSEGGWLFKFQHTTQLLGILSDKGTISTLYIPDEKICKMTPEEYWKEQIRKYGKEP